MNTENATKFLAGGLMAGGAIGIAATEAGYWLGDKLTGERSRWHLGTDGQTLSLRIDL